MHPAPDTPGGLGRALDDATFEGHNLGPRRIKKELDLVLDSVDLECIERNDLVSVVD